jgi:hypothetical protein
MKTENLTAQEAERALKHGYKVQHTHCSGTDYILSVEGLNYGYTSTYRIYTTDEDVAKWRETHKEIELIKPLKQFQYLDKERKDFWRNLYNLHLTTLPELTEGKPELKMGGVPKQPSATVSDEVIEGWWDSELSFDKCRKILPNNVFWDWFNTSEKNKALIRQAYHKAHEKVDHAPQAYKFPFEKVVLLAYDGTFLFIKPNNFASKIEGLSMEEKQYICEAINEKLNRQ